MALRPSVFSVAHKGAAKHDKRRAPHQHRHTLSSSTPRLGMQASQDMRYSRLVVASINRRHGTAVGDEDINVG
jgi:hypothetical protein